MNKKHLAVLVIVILTVVFVQIVLQVRKNLTGMQKEAMKAQSEAEGIEMQLRTENLVLAELEKNSASLIAYLKEWEPQLQGLNSPQAGELNLSAKVKRSGIVTLAQRFESVSTQSLNIPRILRSNMTVEDDYSRTLNWLGELERTFPAARVSSMTIERGQSGNDIRMAVTLDLPLMRNEEGAK